MRNARRMSEQQGKSEWSELRSQYHSLHEEDRDEVIDLLGGMADSEATRELIALFRECQWRSTRMKILDALSRHPNDRSLPFLFERALDDSDLPMAEAAIRALGQTHHPRAARFLVELYGSCEALLKPAVVGGLGLLPDRTRASELLSDLGQALETRTIPFIRQLVLTLGELKVREAVPLLERIVVEFGHRPTELSALMALGKVSRNPDFLERVEARFAQDAFEHQLFASVRSQVRFRAEWKLEDYLSRIFEAAAFHRTLPFELLHFDPKDVREGLRLFAASPGNFPRLCQALSRLQIPGIGEWYSEFFPKAGALPDEQVSLILDSVAGHQDASFFPFLEQFSGRSGAIRLRWLEAVSLALPEADVVLGRALSESPESPGSNETNVEDDRMQVLNALEAFALSAQCRPRRLSQVVRSFEQVLDDEAASIGLRLRSLRALGNLRVPSPRAFAFVRSRLGDQACRTSCLAFLEACPEKDSLELLLGALAGGDAGMVLRALLAQEKLPSGNVVLDEFLKRSLAPEKDREKDDEERVAALAVVGKHRRVTCLKETLSSLSKSGVVRLAAVVALRSIGDESAAEALGKFLEPDRDGRLDESLAGRALDTLTALPGLRARRILIDHLRDHSADPEVCDKILRSITPIPGAPAEYFAGIIDSILQKIPDHPQKDGLIQLRTRFVEAAPAGTGHAQVKGPDIAALDRELKKRIPLYDSLDDSIRSALRAAETPFLHPEMFDENVDKSSSVLAYCKAIDLVLERELGRKHLFPRLEASLHEFQNVLHAIALNVNYPEAETVIRSLGVGSHFNAQSLPLHKMAGLAQGILNGRILTDRLRTLDGLRAWSIVLLLFARRTEGGLKPLIPVRGLSDDGVVKLARRLIWLQEVRNPAAHRQTIPGFTTIEEVRRETIDVLNQLLKLF